jgi:hypothetical protein
MTNSPITSKPKSKAVSKGARAKLILSPAFVKNRMQRLGKFRVKKGADVFLAACLEFLAKEVVGFAAESALSDKVLRIAPKHIGDALHEHTSLARHLKRGIIPRGRTYTPRQHKVWTDRKPVVQSK